MKKKYTMKKALLISGLLALTATPALAAEGNAGKNWFAEGAISSNFGNVDDLEFTNPIGTAFTSNPTSGNKIILNNTDDSDSSLGGELALGYHFDNNAFLKASYSYLGTIKGSGFAAFPAGNFQQVMEVNANILLMEIGYTQPLSKDFFAEASIGGGVAFVKSEGTQGANIGYGNYFPSNTETNTAFKVGIALGYNVSDNVSVILSSDYLSLGKAETAVTNGTEGAINPGEQLSADIDVLRVLLGLRYNF